jgi:hypothetical protein
VKAGLSSAGWEPEIRDLASFQDDYGLKTGDEDGGDADDDDDDDDDDEQDESDADDADGNDGEDGEGTSEDFELVDKDGGTSEKA